MKKRTFIVIVLLFWYIAGVFGSAMRRHDLVHYTVARAEELVAQGVSLDGPVRFDEVNRVYYYGQRPLVYYLVLPVGGPLNIILQMMDSYHLHFGLTTEWPLPAYSWHNH